MVRMALALMTCWALVTPSSVHATIIAGCVGTFETGTAGVVGQVDIGQMLGTSSMQAPALLTVTAPDGVVTRYVDGQGLITPTDVMPIWFAPVHELGEYTVTADGVDCTARVTALSTVDTSLPYELELGWEPMSAPIRDR